MKIKQLAMLVLLLCGVISVQGRTTWELKKDKEGIRIYTGTVAGSDIKAIKVECMIDAGLAQLTALLLDAKAHEQWVYSTSSSYMIKKITDNRQVYYSAMNMPWPVTDRDVVVDLQIVQDPATRVLTVTANVVPGYVAAKKDMVRVPLSDVTWKVTPAGKGRLKIEYIAQADPGGSVPSWAVNMFSTKGPFETFKKLRAVVALPVYQNARFDFINE